MNSSKNRLLKILIGLESILLLPFIGNQFSTEVNWSTMDFVVMGVLLLGLGIMIELVLRISKGKNIRLLLISGLLILFILTWAEMAVGIFGTPIAGN